MNILQKRKNVLPIIISLHSACKAKNLIIPEQTDPLIPEQIDPPNLEEK